MTKCDKPRRVLQRPLFLIALYWTTWLLYRCWKSDVIHAHWIVPQGLAGRLSCGNTMPIFCADHGGNLHSLGAFVFHHIKSLAIRRCNGAAVVSDSPFDKVHFMAPSIRVEFSSMAKDFSAHFTPPPDPDYQLLLADRLAEKKGVRYLLDDFALVFHDCLGLKLTIARNESLHNELPRRKQRGITEGSDRFNVASDGVLDPMLRNKFRRQAASLGINRCVQCLGSLPHAELPEAYRQATLAVLPFSMTRDGDQEVFGLVFFEAMGLSRPVTTSDLPAVRQSIEPGITVIMVQPINPVALAGTIRQCLGDFSLSLAWPRRRCMQYNSTSTGVPQHNAIPACSTN